MATSLVFKILPIVLAFLLIFNSGLASAQNIPSPNTTTQEVESSRIAGQIIRVEDNTLTVNTRDGVKQINVPENIKITKNGTTAPLSDLETGDGVVITRTDGGEVLSVDTLSGTALDISKWVLPVGLGVLVLAILVFLVWVRMKKDYIKTTGTRM